MTIMQNVDIDAFLARPVADRPSVFFREERFVPRAYYDEADCRRLEERRVDYGNGQHAESTLGETRALVEVSAGSAAMEGSTYTLGDTQRLLDTGVAKAGAAPDDTQLVMTHLRAWRELVRHPDPALDDLLRVHRLLMLADAVPASPHFLHPDRAGRWRIDPPDGLVIAGSAYIPPQTQDRGPTFLPEQMERLRAGIRALAHPMDRALAWLSRLPYLQPFADGNKRMGRLLAAAECRWASMPVPRLAGMDRGAYLRGLLAFYELGEVGPLAGTFRHAMEQAVALVDETGVSAAQTPEEPTPGPGMGPG